MTKRIKAYDSFWQFSDKKLFNMKKPKFFYLFLILMRIFGGFCNEKIEPCENFEDFLVENGNFLENQKNDDFSIEISRKFGSEEEEKSLIGIKMFENVLFFTFFYFF